MITIAYEPLVKKYYSSIFSRAFCLSSICYALVILLPLLILININYSWPQYQRIIIQPQLHYQGYQITCLKSDNTLIVNSNFNGQIGTKNYNNIITVAVKNDMVQIKGQIFSNQIQSCNLQIYLLSKIQTSIETIVNLPLSFYVRKNGQNLLSANIMGVIQLQSKSVLPQSSILSLNKSQHNQQYASSMINNWEYVANNNITLKIENRYEQIQSLQTTNSNAFTIDAKYKIEDQIYFKEASLIDKFRGIGPIFIYLAIFLYLVVIDPLVDWMIENKIYSGRTIHAKIKSE